MLHVNEGGYLQAPLHDESDIKIFILFLMYRLARPLEYVDIHDVVVQNGLVSPFDFCMNFPDLIDSGHVRVEKNGEKEWYVVTPRGREVAEQLNGKLLMTTKEKALANAKMLLSLKKTKSDFRYAIEDLPDGRCRFEIRFREKFEDMLTVSVVVDNRLTAEKMQLDFSSHPAAFRRALMNLLDDRVTYVSPDNPLSEK